MYQFIFRVPLYGRFSNESAEKVFFVLPIHLIGDVMFGGTRYQLGARKNFILQIYLSYLFQKTL